MKAWLLASRPKTLTAAFIPVLAATALAYAQGVEIQWWVSIFCLTSALCIQIATNFINDLIDFDKGADTHERIGPTRVTQSGLISRKKLITATVLVLILAVLTGAPLVYWGGWPIMVIGLISIFMAYSYTGGPFPLAYLGLGDFFVIIFFGLIAVGGVFYLLTKDFNLSALILGLQIGLFSTVLIAINNLRDIHQDRKVNKKTIPVRFGARFARFEIFALLIVPFILQLFWLKQGGLLAVLLPLIFLPLAVYIAHQIQTNEPSPKYNRFLALSALLHSGFGVLISVGLILG